MDEISRLAKDQLASQEGLCSMEFAVVNVVVVVVVVVVCCTNILSTHPAHQHNLEVPHRQTDNKICKTQEYLVWSVYTISVDHGLVTKKPSSGVSCSSHGLSCVTHARQFGTHYTMSSYVTQCVNI